MNGMEAMGKILLGIGGFLFLLGVFFVVFSKLNIAFPRLPGDIVIKRENYSFYFPLATCILISVVLSIILNIISRK
jgi:hypothetical protein